MYAFMLSGSGRFILNGSSIHCSKSFRQNAGSCWLGVTSAEVGAMVVVFVGSTETVLVVDSGGDSGHYGSRFSLSGGVACCGDCRHLCCGHSSYLSCTGHLKLKSKQ